MAQPFDGAITPTPHCYEIRGRAAEIARSLGSPVAGAEHLFLAMLHDGGFPVSVMCGLVDLDAVETALLAIVAGPDYSAPAPPAVLVRSFFVQPWGADLAFELGDSHHGVEHILLAILRRPDCVPARALAGLADLDALAAAVTQALHAPAAGPPPDAVFLPEGQEMDAPLRRAIVRALPAGTTFGFSNDPDARTWMQVIGADGEGDRARSRAVLTAALASLDWPGIEDKRRDILTSRYLAR
jgi:Clp amino terminal domain, pathogenicity island component